jgi:hypothetical protein
MHGAGEELEAAVHDRVDGLRIEALRERAEPHDIGEEHRNLLALALERAARREDLLGEVVRGVGLGRGEFGGAWRSRNQRRAAAATELLASLVREPTGGAGERERRPAFGTEAAALAVLGPAARAEHQPTALISASACSSRNRMPIARYIVVAIGRCSWACSRFPVRLYNLPRPR